MKVKVANQRLRKKTKRRIENKAGPNYDNGFEPKQPVWSRASDMQALKNRGTTMTKNQTGRSDQIQ